MIGQFNRVKTEGAADAVEDWDQLVFRKTEYENEDGGSFTVKYFKTEYRGWVLEPMYEVS